MKKGIGRKVVIGLLLILACSLSLCSAGAEGAEPHGEGNGIVSRPLLAAMYKWLDNMDVSFREQLTFDQISNAVGKWGCVKEKDGDEYRAAYWTDGNVYVTVTFRNRDGFWGVHAISTDLSREEYDEADDTFLMPVGNREAGSSPTEPVTLTTEMKPSGGAVTVTAEVPTENWYTAVSFGEARFLNAPNEAAVNGNSSGLRISFWPDEASILAEQEKGENRKETESLYLLGMVMKGCTYTRSGMRMTDYIAEIREDLWMRISVYKMRIYYGSEAEAILKSLAIQYGDYAFSYEPLILDDGEDENDYLDNDYSMAYIEESPYLEEEKITIEEDDGNIYVYSGYSAKELSFSHKMESDQYYSYLDFDILVLHAGTKEVRPILRMWINLYTQEHSMDISSVTFTAGGRKYTFSDLSDEEDFTERDGDLRQTMLIRFDWDSLDLLTDLMIDHLLGETTFQAVFHGTEEIEVELGENFWDVFTMFWDLYENSDARDCLYGYEGNPMESELK